MCGFMFDGLQEENDDDRFVGRECYVFNATLDRNLDDDRCTHCRFYLTVSCVHIHDFVDEEGDV